MVVQKTLDNLKDRSHDEKKAVAGGVALTVVVILMIGWGYFFLRKVQNSNTAPLFEGGYIPQDQYDLQQIQAAQQDINQFYQSQDDQLREIRDSSTQGSAGAQGGTGTVIDPDSSDDQFGSPEE